MRIGVDLVDNFSDKMRTVRRSLKDAHSTLSQVERDSLRTARNIGAGMVVAGVMAVRQMSTWVEWGREFGWRMEYAKSIAKGTNEELSRLSSTARRLGVDTMFTATQVASGMQFMAMAGQSANMINKTISAATDLAGAGDVEVGGKGGSADILTNIMKVYGLAGEESRRVADILAQTITSTNTNLYDLGEAFRYSGDVFKMMNIPLEQAAAMIGILGNQGIPASIAGTSLANALRYLNKSVSSYRTTRQQSALDALGINPQEFQDAEGNLLHFPLILQRIKKGLSQLSTVEAAGALEALTGIRGQRGIVPLLSNLDDLVEQTATNFRSQGRAAEIMGKMMETVEGQFRKAQAAIFDFGVTFTQALEPALIAGAKALTTIAQALSWFGQTMVGKAVLRVGAAFAVFTIAAGAFTVITAGVRLFVGSGGLSIVRTLKLMGDGWRLILGYATAYKAVLTGTISGAPLAGGGYWGKKVNQYSRVMGASSNAPTVHTSKSGRLYTIDPKTRAARFITSADANARRKAAFEATAKGQSRAKALMTPARLMRRGVASVAGRAMGFLGGPVGIALTALTFLPEIMSGINWLFGKNEKAAMATDENTRATQQNTDALKILNNSTDRNQGYLSLADAANAAMNSRFAATNAKGEVTTYADQIRNYDKENSSTNITQFFYSDGEVKMKRVIEDVKNNDIYENKL